MADNADIVILPFDAVDGALVTMTNLTASTTNASGITATWALSRTSQHTTIIASSPLTLLEPIICSGVTTTATNGHAIEYDLDQAVSNGSSPLWEQQTLTFVANSVNNVTLGAMTNLDAVLGNETDMFGLYSPFSVTQYHHRTTGPNINAHSDLGGTTVGYERPVGSGPVWISHRRDRINGRTEVVVQDGVTGAFIMCSRCLMGDNDFASLIMGDYLFPTGGSIKHSFIALGFDAKATLPFCPGDFVLPPPDSVVAIDNASTIDVQFDDAYVNAKAFSYKIERSTNAGASWAMIEPDLEVAFDFSYSVSPYTDSLVSDGVTYLYRITAMLNEWESTTTLSNPITHGDAVWYDTFDPAISDTSDNNSDSSYVRSVSLALPDGVATKLRVWIHSSTTSDTPIKMALYDNSGGLITGASDTVTGSTNNSWKEIVIPRTDMTAGSYKIVWSAQANATDVVYRYKNGSGHTDIGSVAYTLFPTGTLVVTDFTMPGADAAGVFVEPPSTPDVLVSLGEPLFL